MDRTCKFKARMGFESKYTKISHDSPLTLFSWVERKRASSWAELNQIGPNFGKFGLPFDMVFL